MMDSQRMGELVKRLAFMGLPKATSLVFIYIYIYTYLSKYIGKSSTSELVHVPHDWNKLGLFK